MLSPAGTAASAALLEPGKAIAAHNTDQHMDSEMKQTKHMIISSSLSWVA